MILLEQIKRYYPVQLRENASFQKFMLKEYLQLLILDFLSSTPFVEKIVFIGGTNRRCIVRHETISHAFPSKRARFLRCHVSPCTERSGLLISGCQEGNPQPRRAEGCNGRDAENC